MIFQGFFPMAEAAETRKQEIVINLSNLNVPWATYESVGSSGNARSAISALPVVRGSHVIIIFEASKHITEAVVAELRAKYDSCTCMWPKRLASGRSYPPTNQRQIKST